MMYDYVSVAHGESQYSDFDLETETCVPARYVKSKLSYDNGNFLIEALPPPRTKERISDYQKMVPGYYVDDQQTMSPYEKMLAVRTLRQYRSPLPFHIMLEAEFHMMLIESYRNRRCRMVPSGYIKITKEDQEVQSNMVLQGKVAAAANAGCSLIGYSGCGKSSALEILLSNYPQVIEHVTEQELRLTQIVYLPIVCPTNSNFSALYTEIGAAIDRALGNTEPIYEKQVGRCKTLPQKANYICELIEHFAIGCIIFDEIQLIDFKGQKENTFESLLTIVNKTKVALLTVGTEDALEKMYPNLRTGRRAGSLIEASKYCEDQEFFDSILKDLLQYQWVDDKIEPSQKITDAFYRVTGGIIDQLISIYMFVQIDYLSAQKKYQIQDKHIFKTVKKHYPGMQELMKDICNPQAEKMCRELIRKADLERDMIIQQQQQQLATQEIMAEFGGAQKQDIAILRDKMIHNIRSTLKVTGEAYDSKMIENVVDRILRKQENRTKTEDELSTMAYGTLKKRQQNKNSSAKSQNKLDVPIPTLLDAITTLSPPKPADEP